MKKNERFSIDESGRSMVEIVGVMAVMGLITAGAFVLVRGGAATQKRSRAMDEVAVIAENIRGLFAESNDFSELTTNETDGTTLIDSLYLSKTTPFGTNTTYSVVKNSGNDAEFLVLMKGLDEQDCKALAAASWPSANGNASCDAGKLTIVFGK